MISCMQRVDEQYPADQYDKEEQVVSLPNEVKGLQINPSSELQKLKGGWQLRTYPEQCQVSSQLMQHS